jgi:putative flippase GtrA
LQIFTNPRTLDLRQRAHHVWAWFRSDDRLKIVRYIVFGTAVSIGYTLNVVALVRLLPWLSPELSSALSFVIWTPLSYVGHRNFTFTFTGRLSASGVRFFAAFVARLVASAYTVHLATLFEMNYMVGVLANWIVLPLISYFILDFWVFRRPKPAADDAAPPSEEVRVAGG